MSLSNDTKGNEVIGYWNHDAYTQNTQKCETEKLFILGAAAAAQYYSWRHATADVVSSRWNAHNLFIFTLIDEMEITS